jgi:hypothetical protein
LETSGGWETAKLVVNTANYAIVAVWRRCLRRRTTEFSVMGLVGEGIHVCDVIL